MASPYRNAEYSQLGMLSESIHRLLSEKECLIFDRGLADYHRRRNVKILVECLSLVLNTGQKRKLLIPIRDAYVKPSDLSKFNQLVQAHGLATSHRQKAVVEERNSGEGIRKLEVKRDADGEWGFSIRGGSEHGIGIFVSWVEPGSNPEKSGLQVGDQILKANDTSMDRINHHDAVMLMKNTKKLRLSVLAHSRIPGSRMAHKVYHWVDPEGRPTSPPPDPFEIQDSLRTGEYKLMNEADERKVTVIIEKGKELGISIRGGIEHGLGIYISSVEADSVAESYGLKVGDQVLEVNGLSFLGVVHSDAAKALRAESCMVMKIKDVGKLPYSRLTTYSQTKWYPTGQPGTNQDVKYSSPAAPVFRTGVGSQVMLGQQQDNLLKGHGLLKDVAQSVLTEQELALFMYYLNQYQQNNMPIKELLPPILDLLDNPEKLQLLTELRGLIKPQDIQQYNELTVQKEIMAKKLMKPKSGLEFTDGGRDVPQKLSPEKPTLFNIPPPPPSSTQPGRVEKAVDLITPADSKDYEPEDMSIIEARIRSETEIRLKNEFLEKEKEIMEEQQRLLARERADKEATLHREREEMEKDMKKREDEIKREIEEEIRLQLEREKDAQIAEKERELEAERDRWIQEEREKEEEIQLMHQKAKEELEEKVWKEAEERIREEYEAKRQLEREESLQRRTKVSQKAAAWDVEGRIRRDLENRIKRDYEEKLTSELNKMKFQEAAEKRQREEAFQQKLQEEKVAQMEADEQSRIEAEEKIRRETEAQVRAEYESRLQRETEERARLAEEVKVRKEAEERLQTERLEMEKELKKRNKKEEKGNHRERKQIQKEHPSNESEGFPIQDEGFPVQDKAAEKADDFALEQQRLLRLNQEKEKESIERHKKDEADNELRRQEAEKMKKKELQRKREENLRRREEERIKKEIENRRQQEEKEKEYPETSESSRNLGTSNAIGIPERVKVNFGDEESSSLKKRKKVKADTIENERRKAEEKLQRRLKRAQEKKQNELKSFGGFTELEGDILHISVTKVVKKLGIAIDGGANTKQKAVIIREISREGCAALTGMGMAVNQQVLQVNGKSLYGLKHIEVVKEVKSAFDGPMNKVIEFVVLDPPGN